MKGPKMEFLDASRCSILIYTHEDNALIFLSFFIYAIFLKVLVQCRILLILESKKDTWTLKGMHVVAIVMVIWVWFNSLFCLACC